MGRRYEKLSFFIPILFITTEFLFSLAKCKKSPLYGGDFCREFFFISVYQVKYLIVDATFAAALITFAAVFIPA